MPTCPLQLTEDPSDQFQNLDCLGRGGTGQVNTRETQGLSSAWVLLNQAMIDRLRRDAMPEVVDIAPGIEGALLIRQAHRQLDLAAGAMPWVFRQELKLPENAPC